MSTTWDFVQKRLSKTGFTAFPSFDPDHQDQGALFLIDFKRDALKAVDQGDLDTFLELCSWEWASLPDPDTGVGRYPPQSVVDVEHIRDVYKQLFDLWNSDTKIG